RRPLVIPGKVVEGWGAIWDEILNAVRERDGPWQARVLRDISGNPFRPISIDNRWLSWNGGIVSRIAQSIYDQRRFEELPILADALEEAGCEQADLLAHCRQPGEHVRGCWALDLILSKDR